MAGMSTVRFDGSGSLRLTRNGRDLVALMRAVKTAKTDKAQNAADAALAAYVAEHSRAHAATLVGSFRRVERDGEAITGADAQKRVGIAVADFATAYRSLEWSADKRTISAVTVAQGKRGRPPVAGIDSDSLADIFATDDDESATDDAQTPDDEPTA